MKPVDTWRTTRRNLPHIQMAGRVYFLTRRATHGVEFGPGERALILAAIRFRDSRRWVVSATVVMPDHVHILARPLPVDPHSPATVHDLGSIIHSVKGYSAQQVNHSLGRAGRVWQDERHDRIVRDEKEFLQTWDYICGNPVRAGLVDVPEDYAWLYESAAAD